MKHSIDVIGNQARVFLMDKIYVYDASSIRDDLLKVIDQGVTDVRMDLSGLAYIDSSGLGMLLAINKRIKKKNGVFVLAGVQGLPFELIKRTRLDKVFTIL
ncbi:MAG: anti-anti-sigma factor [Desulfosporosinus sp. BRH_c37]|nr:MAG: anti-anti-sigma factor [Desulfosporosinus sp. BRH_c37]